MGKLVDTAREANEFHEMMHPGDWHKPFAEVDIRFCAFIDYMRDECSQRERDLVMISDKLCRVWKMLHIGVQTMKEPMTEHDIDELNMLHNSLVRLNLTHLLFEGLNKKTMAKVNTVFKPDLVDVPDGPNLAD